MSEKLRLVKLTDYCQTCIRYTRTFDQTPCCWCKDHYMKHRYGGTPKFYKEQK